MPVAVVAEVEAVADEELVRHREAGVAHREVVDEAPIGTVEQRDRRQRRRAAERERLADVVERQPGVDDVLDEQDVAILDAQVEILQQPDARFRPRLLTRVAREGDEVELVRDRYRAAEVGDEDDARLQRGDEDRDAALVVGDDLRAQLVDPRFDLLG